MNFARFITPFGGLLCTASISLAVGLMVTEDAKAASLTPVDVELSLLVDGSSSIGGRDFQTQINAYANVFGDASLFEDSISKGSKGKIAVNFIQFASNAVEQIGWTLIDSPEASAAFANQIRTISQLGGGTNMTAAIDLATNGLLNNDFDGQATLSIDISTDGAPNNRVTATAAAQNALNSGVDVINAIAVGRGADVDFLRDNIIGGINVNNIPAFVLEADSFEEFENALATKIFTEVGSGNGGGDNGGGDPTGVPEPVSTAGLAMLGLLGAIARLKRKTL